MSSTKISNGLEVVPHPGEKGGQPSIEDSDGHGEWDMSSSDSELSQDGKDEGVEEKEEIRNGKRFDEILHGLQKQTKSPSIELDDVDITTSTGLSSFMRQNKACLCGKNDKGQTILHLIAEAEKARLPSPRKMKRLLTELVRLSGCNLLAERNEDGKTPLFCALTRRNHRLAKILCDAHRDVGSILKIQRSFTNGPSSNCIHQAILKKSSDGDKDLLLELIDKADESTLRAYNEDGYTPLHLAVAYERCVANQKAIVEALIRRCDKTSDDFHHHPTKGKLSPYRYAVLTYEQWKETEGERKSQDIPKRMLRPDLEEPVRSRDSRGREERKVESGIPNISAPPYFRRQALPEKNILAEKQEFDPTFTYALSDTIMWPDRRSQATPTERVEQGMDMRPKKNHTSHLEIVDAAASEIRQYLKLFYLRTRPHDEAVEFLYGAQQARQIYFDLVGVEPRISKGKIVHGLSHLAFEGVLQYVALPHVEVEDRIVTRASDRQASKPDGKGRNDMKILFEWLREYKKVETILKVIVDDLHEPAHSDETIISCLTKMGVEEWDWRKYDLSPDVIQDAAPDARVVHLYWSGNNAVLRAWSEDCGLRELKKLETVHLYVDQGLETRARTERNVDEFRRRLTKARGLSEPEIVVKDMKLGSGQSKGRPTGKLDDPYERHKWMSCMEAFADFLHTATVQTMATKEERSFVPPKPVKTALIDDGVDINDEAIHSRIIGGRSFCRRDEKRNLNQPYYISGSGHGTRMAGFICKVCPDVELYILRMDEYYDEAGQRQITAKSAAKAIYSAIEEKVDIISMSWTIERTDDNAKDIAELEKAIMLAAGNNILMFCAATDQGPLRDVSYPAATSTKNIFKIGAADASGTAMKALGDDTFVDFIFPGNLVVLERHDDPSVKKWTPVTGSSVATALASALAAVILHCVQLACISRDASDFRDYTELKKHARMKEAFSSIRGTPESKFKFLAVWNRFEQIVKDAEKYLVPKDEYIDKIVELAKELMRRV